LALPPQAVTSPEEHLGRPVGADFTLADWDEVAGYYRLVAEQSPHVELEVVGETTEGREFLLATIGSVENLARLAELKAVARRIADPRGLSDAEAALLLDESVPFLFVSLGMHSTECAAPQFGMELLHLLATSDREPYRSARERVVVFMPACLNPDGLDRVTRWYREHVGTPYEATGLTELYQRYAGHDNNRDWFGMALEETRVVTRLLYGELFPHVYWDVHQQGSTEERFFVPPYRDPLNGNLDAGVITAIDLLGTRALHDMQREGLTGISTGVSYDMWWNGGNRNVPVRKNIAGLLTEAASANLGSPAWLPIGRLSAPGGVEGGYRPSNRFPSPWPGGWWRVRDVVEYEHAFARSLLGS
ncbi:MAG TPA: M14 family zinc carboxypeptidase, partial [Planctomycetota bacterium]|nr:M14 family zinc carboxypeptidase [Planctomycetota bacterium]